jgi:hypothetical protein
MAYRSKEELHKVAENMQTYLETETGPDPQHLMDRIELLNLLIAKSGQCLAEAKYIQDQIINTGLMNAIGEGLETKLSPSLINQFVKSNAKDVNLLVNWFDRINAAATHQLDSLRTIISYKKAELNL